MRTPIALLLLFVLVPAAVNAEPRITNVTGTLAHGGEIVISGGGFGEKDPAAPLVWDDGTTSPPLSARYDGWLPSNAQQGSFYNMSYRAVPFRGIGGPNARVNFILGGAHATADLGDTYRGGGNVGLGKNMTSHSYYISYSYRIDPLFDEEAHPTLSDNMKEIVLSNQQGSFYPDGWGAFGYAGWCNDPGKDVPDENYRGPVVVGREPIDPAHQAVPYGCSGNNLVYHNSPINGWVKMQWEGRYNYQFDSPQFELTTYPDGRRVFQSHYGDGLTLYEYARGPWVGYPKANDLRFIAIGGFARVPRADNGTNSFRYFAEVYIDITHARVMIGDRPAYSSCTVMEPQIPVLWSDGSIRARLNLGAIPDDGTAYLYVFNADDSRNPQGYPLTFGPRDTVAPAPPVLRLMPNQ